MIIPIFFIASVIIFLLVRIAPGDVASSIVGGGKTTAETLEAIRVKYHLDEPIFIQYGIWLKGIFQGDWGISYQMNTAVLTLIKGRIGLTLQLLGMGFIIGILFSMPLGIISAVKRGTAFDNACSMSVMVSAFCPAYFIGMLCMLVFSYHFRWFPVYGSGKGFIENLYYLFLPALAIGIGMIAMNARTLRSAMISSLESNYVLTAKAKGISKARMILYHALKSSIIPYFTISGVQIASMIGSTSIIEQTFSISGIGSLLVDAVARNDYPVVQGVTLVIIICVILAPVLAPYNPEQMDLSKIAQGPSSAHIFGTDNQGRDVFSRILYGGYTALLSPLAVVGIALLIGVPLGLISGYTHGAADNVIMRTCDVILSFLSMLLALITVSILGRGIQNIVVILGFFYIPMIARMVRSNVIVQREQEYVEACKAMGYSSVHIMVGHILPNCFSTIIVEGTLCLGYALLDISALSFLGLGVQEPNSDWGKMLADGKDMIMKNPNLAIAAGVAIMLVVMCVNLIGDGLDSYFDPKRRKV